MTSLNLPVEKISKTEKAPLSVNLVFSSLKGIEFAHVYEELGLRKSAYFPFL